MKATHNLNTRGMTLIELMIVVSVIAIIAAIVVPRFSNANDTAKASSLASQLSTLKKTLILYKTDHNDVYPTDAQLITNQWQVMTTTTDINGDTAGSDFGPYIPKPPTNGFTNTNTVAADNSGAWQYDASTGTIQAVVPQSVIDRAEELNLDTNDLVAAP